MNEWDRKYFNNVIKRKNIALSSSGLVLKSTISYHISIWQNDSFPRTSWDSNMAVREYYFSSLFKNIFSSGIETVATHWPMWSSWIRTNWNFTLSNSSFLLARFLLATIGQWRNISEHGCVHSTLEGPQTSRVFRKNHGIQITTNSRP